jgi:hypothetical protein
MKRPFYGHIQNSTNTLIKQPESNRTLKTMAHPVWPAAQRPNHPAPGRRLAGFNPTERTTEGGGLISNRSPSFIRAN